MSSSASSFCFSEQDMRKIQRILSKREDDARTYKFSRSVDLGIAADPGEDNMKFMSTNRLDEEIESQYGVVHVPNPDGRSDGSYTFRLPIKVNSTTYNIKFSTTFTKLRYDELQRYCDREEWLCYNTNNDQLTNVVNKAMSKESVVDKTLAIEELTRRLWRHWAPLAKKEKLIPAYVNC